MSNRNNDDINKRQKYKDNTFGNKKSISDDYTGERIFKGNSSEMTKKHTISKTTDIDHITPIAVVEKRYGDLKSSQIKKLANEEYNYAATNSTLNRSKGALENHEYLIREAKNGNAKNLKTTVKITRYEINSRTRMAVQATGMRIQNTAEAIKNTKAVEAIKSETQNVVEGSKQQLADSVIPLTRMAIFGMCQAAVGEKNVKDAVSDVAKQAVDVAVQGGIERLKKDVSKAVVKSNSNMFSKIASSNSIIVISKVAQVVKFSAQRYLNGEIDGKDFIEEIGYNGIAMVAGMIGGQVGKELGQIICGIIGTFALPGGGTIAGIAIGSVVGEILGSIITTVACSAITTIRHELKHMDDYKIKASMISSIEKHALAEMKQQRENIRTIISEECSYWDSEIECGFDLILKNACVNSCEGIADGLDKILALFNSKVAFSTVEEYKAQLNKPLILNF